MTYLKRALMIIICIAVIASCFAVTAAADSYIRGDSDGDGKVTILDATKIQRVLAGLDADKDGMIALRGDSDGGGLDIMDATRIQRHLAGFTETASIGSEVSYEPSSPTEAPTDSEGWGTIIYRP